MANRLRVEAWSRCVKCPWCTVAHDPLDPQSGPSSAPFMKKEPRWIPGARLALWGFSIPRGQRLKEPRRGVHGCTSV
jgi:hypothetical protein